MKKKLLSILLSLSMVLSSVSMNAFTVFADETDDVTEIPAIEELPAEDSLPEELSEPSAKEIISEETGSAEVIQSEEISEEEQEEIELVEETEKIMPALSGGEAAPWEDDFEGTVMELTQEDPVTVTPDSNIRYYWFSFVAEEDVQYEFSSSYDTASGLEEPDTCAYLFDSEGMEKGDDDDSGSGYQFSFASDLTAGETYYLKVFLYNDPSVSADFTVSVGQSASPVEIQTVYNFPEYTPLGLPIELEHIAADILYSDGSVRYYKYYEEDLHGDFLDYAYDSLDFSSEGVYPVEIIFGNLSANLDIHVVSWDELDLQTLSVGNTNLDIYPEYTYAAFTAPSTGFYEFSTYSDDISRVKLLSEDAIPDSAVYEGNEHLIDYEYNYGHDELYVEGNLTQGKVYLLQIYPNKETSITVTTSKLKEVTSVTASISGTAYLNHNFDSLTYSIVYKDGSKETGTITDVDPNGSYKTAKGSRLKLEIDYSTFIAENYDEYPQAGPADLEITCNGLSTVVPVTITPRVEGLYAKAVTMKGESETIDIPAVEDPSGGTKETLNTYFVKITPSVTTQYECVHENSFYHWVYLYDDNDRLLTEKKPLLEAGKSYLLAVMHYGDIEEGTVTIRKARIATGMTINEAPSQITSPYQLTDAVEVEITYDNGETETRNPFNSEGMDYDTFDFSLYRQVTEDGEPVWEKIGSYYSNIDDYGSGIYKYVLTMDNVSAEFTFEYSDSESLSELSIVVPQVFDGYIDKIRVKAVYGEDVREANIMRYENEYGTYLDWTLSNVTEGYDIDLDWVNATGTEYLPAGTYSLDVSLDGVEVDANFEVLTIDEAFPALEFGSNQLTPENEIDMYSFVPEESGLYRFDTHNDFLTVYDDVGYSLIRVMSCPGSGIVELEAGRPYRLAVSYVDDAEEYTLDISYANAVEDLQVFLNKTLYGGVQNVAEADIMISYTDANGDDHEYRGCDTDPNGYNLLFYYVQDENGNDVDSLEPDETYELRYNLAGKESFLYFTTDAPSNALPDLLNLSSLEITPTTHDVYRIETEEDLPVSLTADNTFVRINIFDENYNCVLEDEYIFHEEEMKFDLPAGNYFIDICSCTNGTGTLYIKGGNKLEILEQPQYVTAGVNTKVSFHVEAKNAASYQWEYSKNGSTWYKSSASSAKTDTISITVSKSNCANVYRCKVTGTDGKIIYSESAGINLIPGAVINEQPEVITTTDPGESVTFHIDADNVMSYQWQYSKNGTNWYNTSASGNKTDTMTITLNSNNRNNIYRCKLTGLDGNTVCSKSCCAIVLNSQPEDVLYVAGQSVSFSVSGDTIESYQWQYSKDEGATWYNSGATGNTTDTLTLTAKSTNKNTIFRCKITNSLGVAGYSNYAGFTNGLTILTQPSNATATVGEKAVFTVEAANVASYQWYYTKNGTNWYKSSASGSTGKSLTITVSSSNVSNKYRCLLTGSDGKTLYTNTAGVITG